MRRAVWQAAGSHGIELASDGRASHACAWFSVSGVRGLSGFTRGCTSRWASRGSDRNPVEGGSVSGYHGCDGKGQARERHVTTGNGNGTVDG